jgi:serine/threonine-protein kinase
MPVADRHLLFGLLALQNGLIDQVQLIGAFQSWTRDRARPLAEHLVALGHLDSHRRQAVEAIVAVHLEANGGQVQRSLAAISAGAGTRASLDTLDDPEIVRTLTALAPGAEGHDRDAGYCLRLPAFDGQRFRVLRPLDHGGLGAVFVALDEELHREVALKQILEEHADDPASRARFLLEAEITGRLEHPGIVPVYGLGVHAEGRPFYAMRLVKGESLKEVADRFHADASHQRDHGRRSLELRKLLRSFHDVCNAIEYAHSRGVLHRDIKPANVIIGKYGETLVVDWGLAKAVGRTELGPDAGEQTLVPSLEAGSAGTLPGGALGTPAFMSPEQAEGDLEHLGMCSDVYGLGATLYYLLTGCPPVAGTIAEMLAAVKQGDIRPPRQVDATIDPALEAVCLKAMARRPTDRYAMPRALSEDVERWMADAPVLAWREPPSRRARRWARRNRMAVTAAVVTLIVGVLGLSSVLLVQTKANRELENSRSAVQARYRLAVDAIRSLTEASSLLEQTGRTDEAIAAYQRSESLLAGPANSDASARQALAVGRTKLGGLLYRTGRTSEAMTAYRRAQADLESLVAAPGATDEAHRDLADTLNNLGLLLAETGRPKEAEAEYRKAQAINEVLAKTHPSIPEFCGGLASTHFNLGVVMANTGRPQEAETEHRAALALRRKLAEDHPDVAEFRNSLARSHNSLGLLLRSQAGKSREAESEYRAALALLRKLDEDYPAVTDFRWRLAAGRHNLGLLMSNTRRPKEAEIEFRAAAADFQKLAEDHPSVTDFRNSLATSRSCLGNALANVGRVKEAEAEHRVALAVQRKLAEDHPDVINFRERLVLAHSRFADLLSWTGRLAEAEAELRTMQALQRGLTEDHPGMADFLRDLAGIHDKLGILLFDAGRIAAAEVEFHAAIRIYRDLLSRGVELSRVRAALAASHLRMGMLRERTGDWNDAIERYRAAVRLDEDPLGAASFALGHLLGVAGRHEEAIALYRRLIEARPKDARGPCFLANALLLAGRADEAVLAFREVVRLSEQVDAGESDGGQSRYRAVEPLNGLGWLLQQTGRPKEAEAEYREALAIARKLEDDPNFAYRSTGEAMTENNLSVVLRHLGRVADARDHAERAVAVCEVLLRKFCVPLLWHPATPYYRGRLALSCLNRGLARRALGDFLGAGDDVRRTAALLDALPSLTAELYFLIPWARTAYRDCETAQGIAYYSACAHAALASLAGKAQSGVSAAEEASEAAAAMALLHRAVALGHRDAEALRTEDALDPLRDRVDFRLLLMDLSFPAEPFVALP